MKQYRDQFQISPSRDHAPLVRNRVREGAVASGLAMDAVFDLEVAVGEAISNAILYGSPDHGLFIDICCYSRPETGAFIVEIRDHGPGFDPATVRRAVRPDDVGGRGIAIMQALVDEVKIVPGRIGTTVTLVKKG